MTDKAQERAMPARVSPALVLKHYLADDIHRNDQRLKPYHA